MDECHNLMPAPFGEDSQLCRTLGLVAPRFEHRLFLSATPHNGHTRSFTGLLEMLDPVRFSRTSEMGRAMRARIDDLVIRRLKRDVNASAAGPKFCTRQPPEALRLAANAPETELSNAFDGFRTAVAGLIADGTQGRRRAGTFAVEVLGKRLLSCPAAFADSWQRTVQGMKETSASDAEVRMAQDVLGQETGDDREAEKRQATAATVVGGWLKNYRDNLAPEIWRIQRAVTDLGFDLGGPAPTEQSPTHDARFHELTNLIKKLLRHDGRFRDDERLIVFTEYKTTLDYLANRLRGLYLEDRILTLFGVGGPGGMGSSERESVKDAFNDPDARVRILIATDAASEGLNLHRTARYLLHYDCPWNPSRLEQRNGRLDRYGQARDVIVHHFDSDADPDIQFLNHVIRKADAIREDLGSANEIFDRAVRRRLIDGEDRNRVQDQLDFGIIRTQGEQMRGFDSSAATGNRRVGAGQAAGPVRALADAIDLRGQVMAETLEAAMAMSGSRPQLEPTGEPDLYRIRQPDLPGWKTVIDRSVRRSAASSMGGLEPVRKIAVGPAPFMDSVGNLEVFKTRPDALLLHLAHPLMKRALGMLTRRRFPGEGAVSRWTVRIGGVPLGLDALILLSVEELGVNELREPFHHWVRIVAFPVCDEEVGDPLGNLPSHQLGAGQSTSDREDRELARDVLDKAVRHLRQWLRMHQNELTAGLKRQMEADSLEARKREDARYRRREGEVSRLIEQSTVDRLNREIKALKVERKVQLFDEAGILDRLDRSIEEKEREIERRRRHYDEIRGQLRSERRRILDRLLPARFALSGEARVFPITVEVRLSERTALGGRYR